MSISLSVRVEAAIDSCVRSVVVLPESYKELTVCLCMSRLQNSHSELPCSCLHCFLFYLYNNDSFFNSWL